MGVAKLKKAELYYHKSVHEEIAAALQETGVCQIIGDAEGGPAVVEARLSESEAHLADVRYLMRTLTPHFNDPISSLDRTLGERPVVSMSDLSKLAHETDLSSICTKVRGLEHETGEVRLELSQARANQGLLEAFSFLPCPLSAVTEGTRTLAGVAGTVKADQLEAFKTALREFSEDTELILEPSYGAGGASPASKPKAQDIHVVLFFTRSRGPAVLEACVKKGLSVLEIPSAFKGTVSEERTKMTASIATLEEREAALVREMEEVAETWMPAVQKLSDYWNSLAARYTALGRSGETERTQLTRFWVPAKDAEAVQKKIEAVSPNVALFLSDPAEDEEPPTLLENGDYVRPFNILTELYSPPKYRGIDPTPLLAPFFFIFFGMCLGDAGYAIVMLAAIWWLFRKYRRVPLGVRDFIVLFAFSAVSTFVYGIISGSFFGNFIDSFLPFLVPVKNALMLVDPMTNPMQVLGISLLLGVIHLMFGLLIAAYDNFRNGQPVDAIGADISWFLLIVGLCLMGVAMGGMVPPHFQSVGQAMAIIGAVIIFWYAGREKSGIISKIISGFLALYGSTSYLGDILSYSRLLALGFGSAVIGMIINLLGGMAADIPYIGWLIAVVVIAGGHLFSILINLLGAFVHPLRLQYVEFFGKFYTGGGEPFTPLALSEEFVSVKQ
ncbi:MAG: V-type ATP synthase subunit I [Fretibacterium sp.]|nr:V-type ATP synthase subunit I [Fretibacterium sp.]